VRSMLLAAAAPNCTTSCYQTGAPDLSACICEVGAPAYATPCSACLYVCTAVMSS
jgi:hypothetical protein